MDLIYPQMITSSDNNRLFGEPIKDSLNKYNNHNHARAQVLNFLAAGVRLDDIVDSAYVLTDAIGTNVSLFDEPASVLSFSSNLNTITVSQSANVSASNFILKVIRGNKTFYVSNCSSVKDSNLITLNDRLAGFLEGSILESLATSVVTVSFSNLSNNVLYPIIINSPFAFYLDRLQAYTVIDIYDSDYSSTVNGQVTYYIGEINNSNPISANTKISVNNASLNLTTINKSTTGYCDAGDNLCLVFSNLDTEDFNSISSSSILVSLTLKRIIPCPSHHYNLITI